MRHYQIYLPGADYYLADAEIAVASSSVVTNTAVMDGALRRRADAARRWYEEDRKVATELYADSDDPQCGVRLLNLLEISHMWVEAELATCKTDAERQAVVARYFRRTKDLDDLIHKKIDGHKEYLFVLPILTFFRKDAEIREEQEHPPGKPASAAISERLEAAQRVYMDRRNERPGPPFGSMEWYYHWSKRWRDAALAKAAVPAERRAAAEAHLARMKQLKLSAEGQENPLIDEDVHLALDFYLAEAEFLLTSAERSN